MGLQISWRFEGAERQVEYEYVRRQRIFEQMSSGFLLFCFVWLQEKIGEKENKEERK